MRRPARAIVAQNGAFRRWLTLAALLAFFLQGLAIQTHIHPDQLPAGTVVAAQQPVPAPLKGLDTIDQCRLCQEMVHGAALLEPPAFVLAPSQLFTLAVLAVPPLAAPQAVSGFDWQSRAPPRR